jgi:hypothetical protein
LFVALAGLAALGGGARADESSPHLASYSPYERATIREALEKTQREIEPDPEGKLVEKIDIITLDVIEESDPAPAFLNWFHVTTQRYVVAREILQREGQRYRQELVDETARNLREVRQLSVVLCIPVRGSRPDSVRLLIITKDVWSLRLNSNFRYSGGRFEFLLLQPSEENLFGTHHSISATFSLTPGTYSFGARYVMPRIGGSQIRFSTEANIFLNRDTGDPEGSYGSVVYGQPLYATEAEWAWGTTIAWRNELFRRYCTGSGSACAGDLRGFDAAATLEDDAIPQIYRSDILGGLLFVTRSFGRSIKHDVTLGMEVSRRVFRPLDLSGYDAAAVGEFMREVLPVSDTRVGPYIEYRTVPTSFMRTLDFETLGLQEDVRLGHEVILRIMPVTKLLNSTRNFVSLAGAARYTWPLRDGIVSAIVESAADVEAERIADGSIEAGARVMTPRLGFGRLIFDARVYHRYRNYLNKTVSLGGSTRLRGYPTQAYLGKDLVVATLEFRTRPVEILSCQLAGAAFFDAGDAFDGWGDFHPKQSAGFGLRILFPQLDRTVLRADWGFPLTRGYRDPDSLPGDIVVTFKQAFSVPDVPTKTGTASSTIE